MEYNGKINSFGIYDEPAEGTRPDERLRNVVITYYSNNEFFADSPKYSRISEEKIKLVMEKLFDYTLYNQIQDNMARVIPFLTIVSVVEKIFLEE